jgi:hypothetical protein
VQRYGDSVNKKNLFREISEQAMLLTQNNKKVNRLMSLQNFLAHLYLFIHLIADNQASNCTLVMLR